MTLRIFERKHHQMIAQVLRALDARLLLEHHCLFAGGTVIAMRFGEYRESVDIDFLVSDRDGYGQLRALLKAGGMNAILGQGAGDFVTAEEFRIDQYGLRTQLWFAGSPIKFEIVLEGRIGLAKPKRNDVLCGVSTLTPLDMATSKLLANSDRWNDDGVFNRDVIDLAMMRPALPLLQGAVTKAETAYRKSIKLDLANALARLQDKPGWLERCMQVMAMTSITKAEVWQRLRALKRVL
jgi:hypothetical protein